MRRTRSSNSLIRTPCPSTKEMRDRLAQAAEPGRKIVEPLIDFPKPLGMLA